MVDILVRSVLLIAMTAEDGLDEECRLDGQRGVGDDLDKRMSWGGEIAVITLVWMQRSRGQTTLLGTWQYSIFLD